MAFKSIDSEEVFGKPTMSSGEPPKHTERTHERCAYYVMPSGFMECPHGDRATGAFYSEDFFKPLQHLIHLLINDLDSLHHLPKSLPRLRTVLDHLKEWTR